MRIATFASRLLAWLLDHARFTRRALIPASALVLAACGNTPPVPDWQMNAKSAMERAQNAYLEGDSRVEAVEFARARKEVSSTGRNDLVARIELARCATRVASLVFEDCAGFAGLAQDAPAAELAYAAYLAGRIRPLDAALLPEQHRSIAQGNSPVHLNSIVDPLARLVAAGVLLQSNRADPVVIASAISTASAQGWRRPLLAWLGVQAKRAEAAGDTAEVARIQRRIALASAASGLQP
jgi:hypothetical protein